MELIWRNCTLQLQCKNNFDFNDLCFDMRYINQFHLFQLCSMYYTLCAIRFPVVNSNINLQGVLSMEEICLIKNWQLTIWNFYSCLKLLKESKKILKKRCENLFLRGRNCNENNESYGSSPPPTKTKQNKKPHIFIIYLQSNIL